jgi:hypothetical protein
MYCRSLRHTPGNFRIEATFNPTVGFMKFALNFPILKIILSEILVKQGKIFLRPYKVDPAKPEEYWVEGFKVRNRSQRQDGTYLTAGGVHRFNSTN